MIKCDKCNSDLRVCPVCGNELCEDVHHTWFHPCSYSADVHKCPWSDAHLNDAQLEWLVAHVDGKYVPRKYTACQFCRHFVGHKAKDYNQRPCGFRTSHTVDADKFAKDEVVRHILHALARMDRCPEFEEKRS